jgi:predicted O-methyltransferase YrrM
VGWLDVARQAKGFMPDDEGDALYRAACEAGPGTFVEIGTYCAKSALYIGAAAREGGSVLFTIDHHRGSEEMQPGWQHHDPEVVDPVTGEMDSLPFARLHLRQAGLEDHVVLVVGRSDQVARHWPGQVQLLFVDGGHGAEAAAADFGAWVPKVAPGGVLAVHDVFEDPALGGQVPFELYRGCLEPPEGGSPRFEEVGRFGSLRVARRRGGPAF